MPNPWHTPSKDPNAAKHDPDRGTAVIGTTPHETMIPGTVRGWLSLPRQVLGSIFARGPIDAGGDDNMENDTDDDYEYHFGRATDVKEVWFAGCHSDVGGGSTRNNDIHTLANPSLQWMVSEVLKYAPFVLFRPDAFTYDKAFSTYTITKSDLVPKAARPRIPSAFLRAGASPGENPLAASAPPTPSASPNPLPGTAGSAPLNGATHDEEQKIVSVEQTDPETDANAPKNDQLVKKPVWLILEYIPIFQYYQDETGTWHWRFRWNARRPREIYDSTPNFHASVKLRKDYEGKWLTKFIPKKGEEVKINYVE
ncbi:hypothetical protein FRB90_009100 [Tulasnella sp. 427]|nr:hypothetical protein FRB90_009100 [Tulasnella sp. 427]